jgi:hypothetical protein
MDTRVQLNLAFMSYKALPSTQIHPKSYNTLNIRVRNKLGAPPEKRQPRLIQFQGALHQVHPIELNYDLLNVVLCYWVYWHR